LDVGLSGRNAAREMAEDSNVRWKGIDIVMLKIREEGR
jgi:hypothetical protein